MNAYKRIVFSILSLILAACTSLPSPFLTRIDGELIYSKQEAKVHSPIWSSNGSEIAFSSTDFATGKSEIFILDVNTLRTTLLIGDEYFDIEDWSAENEFALSGYGGIWTMELGNTMPSRASRYGHVAAWAPSGRTLAVFENISLASGGRLENLHLIDLDNKTDAVIHSINVEVDHAVNSISWSPDGGKIAYSITLGDYDSGAGIYVLELENNKVNQLITDDGNYNRQPVWSPDSEIIAYLSSPPKLQASYVNFSNLEGSCVIKTGNIGWVDIAWPPDGAYLIYTRDSGLFRLDLFQFLGDDFLESGSVCR